MKRDMDLCREILLQILYSLLKVVYNFTIVGYEKDILKYHCDLLKQAGFLKRSSKDITGELMVGDLTWEGHEFIDKIRQDTVWNKVKEIISKKGLPMAFDVIKNVASSVMAAMTQGAIQGMF